MYKVSITDNEFIFIIQTVLVLVSYSYAHIKSGFIDKSVIKLVKKEFDSSFTPSKIKNKNDLRDFVHNTAAVLNYRLNNLKMGFCYFAINLILKRLALILDDKYKSFLDAPLNKDELASIPNIKYIHISSINNKNSYIDVMDKASNFANSLGKSLYEWELEEYELK